MRKRAPRDRPQAPLRRQPRDLGDGDPQGRGGVRRKVAEKVEELGVVRAEVECCGGEAVEGFVLEGGQGGAAVDEGGVPGFFGREDVCGVMFKGEVDGGVGGVRGGEGVEGGWVEALDAVGMDVRGGERTGVGDVRKGWG